MRTVRIETFGREEFLTERWIYWPGEHVTFLGPTDWGKTTLAFQLLEQTARPKLPATVLVMKPEDDTVAAWSKKLGMRRVQSWPPVTNPFLSKQPPGYVLWPKHSFDPDKDDPKLWREFRTAILYNYKYGRRRGVIGRITFGDESVGLKDLGLERELNAVWMRGRSMGNGLWTASQRPFHAPLNGYSQAAHLFIGNDPDKNSRKRYGEIGGVDARLVEEASLSLEPHAWLYIRRKGRVMCIVEP